MNIDIKMFYLLILLYVITFVHGSELSTATCSSANKCTSCQGPCNSDADCQDGYCYRGHENVPGCTGTGVSGYTYCTKFMKLSRILSSAPSTCNSNSELEIWANVGVSGAEAFSLASHSWKTNNFEVTGDLSLPINTITSADIKDGTIVAADIGPNVITASQIGANAIGNSELKTSSSFTIGDGYTFTAGYLTAGNGLKAADNAFEIIDDNVDGGSACTMNLKGWIHITSSPRGDQTDGNYQTSNYVYYIKDSGPVDETFNSGSWYDDAISIDAEGAILSSTYIGASDERIKKDIRALKDNESLDLLRQLDAKSYKYRDPIQRHPGETIGFIAQDVKKTIPAAVTTLTRIIPNEMRIITVKFEKITADSWKMTLNEEISPGTYRFVFETLDDEQVVEDLTTEDGKIFNVERQYKKEVVLYGKEVDDFLTIDKQKIFAVAYSALQQVDKNQQLLTERVAKLEKHSAKHWEVKKEDKIIKALEDKITKLEERLSQLEK